MATLQTENEKLSRELIHTRTILEQKLATNHGAMNELLANYEAAEKGRIEAIRQKESVLEEMNNLK